MILPGYYELQGVPLLIYTTATNEPTGAYIKYDLREDAKEIVTFTDGINQRDLNTGFVQYIPIIKAKKLPAFMDEAL